ncbi:hypothetical protein BDW69DRAFT_172657 [Aspergillus filifer]
MWFDNTWEDRDFLCPNGTKWNIRKKLSEKEISSDPESYYFGGNTSEAQAVFEVQQVLGSSVGKRAILKIRLQIPEGYEDYVSPDPSVRARYASEKASCWTVQEFQTLSWLTEGGCSVTPRLLYTTNTAQEGDDMPVPGGWMVCFLMEKVPGVRMTEFWRYDLAQRNKIRQAFLTSMTELCSHNVYHWDNGSHNLIYDEDQDKCYIIDFEDSDIDDTATEPILTLFDDEDVVKGTWRIWGLGELDPKNQVLTEMLGQVPQEDEMVQQVAANMSEIHQGGSLTTVC